MTRNWVSGRCVGGTRSHKHRFSLIAESVGRAMLQAWEHLTALWVFPPEPGFKKVRPHTPQHPACPEMQETMVHRAFKPSSRLKPLYSSAHTVPAEGSLNGCKSSLAPRSASTTTQFLGTLCDTLLGTGCGVHNRIFLLDIWLGMDPSDMPAARGRIILRRP